MIEFDPRALLEGESRKPLPGLPTELGFYVGTVPANGEPVVVELKADGKFHSGPGTLNDVERYAPYEELVRKSEAREAISGLAKVEIADEILQLLIASGDPDTELMRSARYLSKIFHKVIDQNTFYQVIDQNAEETQ